MTPMTPAEAKDGGRDDHHDDHDDAAKGASDNDDDDDLDADSMFSTFSIRDKVVSRGVSSVWGATRRLPRDGRRFDPHDTWAERTTRDDTCGRATRV